MTKVLVYGYYGSEAYNAGDILFKDAFKEIFPEYTFTFTDFISTSLLSANDKVFFGGGSFLEGAIRTDAWELLKTKPIYYIGVGADTNIHQSHQELIKLAKAVLVRSNLEKVKQLNTNSHLIGDLVFCLSSHRLSNRTDSILFLTNANVVPAHSDPIYKLAAWQQFVNETAQFMDENPNVEFGAMSVEARCNDRNSAIEISNRCIRKPKIIDIFRAKLALTQVSKYSCIITQRFHGIILAQLTDTPYVAICHHSKLSEYEPKTGQHISYYETHKNVLNQAIKNLKPSKINHQDIKFIREICESTS